MTKLDTAKLLDAEALPHRKSKNKSGKGAKNPCPGNLDGNGAHTYEIIKENILLLNNEFNTYHHKECIGCGKSIPMSYKYNGEFYEERTQEYMGRNVNGPVYRRIK